MRTASILVGVMAGSLWGSDHMLADTHILPVITPTRMLADNAMTVSLWVTLVSIGSQNYL